MSTSISEELQTLTRQYKVALEERAEAQIEADRLDAIDEEGGLKRKKDRLARQRLQIQLAAAEGRAELTHRSTALKATDSSARAAVKSDPEVVRLKLELLALEEQAVERGDVVSDAEKQKTQERLVRADAAVAAVLHALETYRVLVASRTDRE